MMSTYQVRSLDEADQIIREHERKTKTNYALLRSTKNFGCVDVPACANEENEVRFETVGVPYCGVPFFVAGLKILQCQSFRVRGGRKKKEIKIELTGSGAGVIGEAVVSDAGGDEEDLQQKPYMKKKKKIGGRSHKVGCTATIIMKEVIYYPEFQLFEHSKNNRIAVARQLKDALKAKTPVQKDRIIYVTVPGMSDHFGHSVGLAGASAKRLYVKNDFYGHNEPGNSKRVYYPVKQEKVNVTHLTKRCKVDEDDTEARAKEVREILQSIMGLTYKQPGTTSAYGELYKDLLQAKVRYQNNMDSLMGGGTTTTRTAVVGAATATVQIQNVDPVAQNGDNQPQNNTSTKIIVNNGCHSVVQHTTAGQTVCSGQTMTIVPVGSGTPLLVTAPPSASGSTLPVSSVAATVVTTTTQQSQQQQQSNTQQQNTTSADGSNQETSIFIEAMEAILNSQM